ncbi:MAG: PIN domain-containing protein [Planctomycetota bacterium]
MIILDTNVISAAMQREPTVEVVAWLDQQAVSSVWTTAVTVFEIEFGLRRLPEGKRRAALEEAFRALLTEELGNRILPFDAQAAIAGGTIAAELEGSGNHVEIRDLQIASIASVRNATVATRNVRHFERACSVVNPWEHG